MRQGTWIYKADSVGEQADASEEESAHVPQEQIDDWDFAARFRDIQRYGYLQPKEKLEMSERAIQAIVDRAHEMLGPIQKPYAYEHWSAEELMTRVGSDPSLQGSFTAELDIEETLAHFGIDEKGRFSPRPIFQVKFPLHHGLVLVLDTSLSMKGEKLAFLAATVAAVAMSVPSESLAVIGFDSEIHVIKSFAEGQTGVHEWVSRVLSIPPGGFTHIELGLKTARTWIEQSGYPQARVILVSDGRYTEGKDPVDVVRGQSFVHTIKVGKDPHGRKVMREIADQANGNYHEVREMKDLPRVLLSAVRSWVR